MINITITRKTNGLNEDKPNDFSVEASDLGLHHFWPKLIATTLGNQRPFIGCHQEFRDGDLCWIDYQQEFGSARLRIWND